MRARVTGILEKRLFQEGGPVTAGQTLYVIDPKPFAAQVAAAEAEVARAAAQATQADREVARLKPLAERRAIGQKEADDAVSNAELAAAGVKAAAAAHRGEAQPRLHTRRRADHRTVEPVDQVRRQPRQRQRHAAHGHLAGGSDLGVVHVSENERLALDRAVAAGKLALPKDYKFDVTVKLTDGSTFPRKDASTSPIRA